jgi:hypothetical protein
VDPLNDELSEALPLPLREELSLKDVIALQDELSLLETLGDGWFDADDDVLSDALPL